MTNQEIDELEAGGLLDTLIARQVMGWDQSWVDNHDDDLLCIVLPGFSSRIEQAWRVVEKISELIYKDEDEIDRSYLMLAQTSHSDSKMKFVATFATVPNEDEWYERDLPFTSRAETAALAICRAALKTVQKKIGA